MTFVIPDKVLEELVCDSCYKYLSVKPVKVYPNKKIKCGRCCQEGDSGVVSVFGLIAENSIFKCVNRFDGCRQLLTYEQVSQHEKSCIGEQYPCRICVGSSAIPTYSFIKHFEYEHKRNILKWPMFVIKLDCSGVVHDSFLYRIENTLYMIYFEVDLTRNVLVLGAESLRKDNFENKQRFRVSYGQEIIFTTKIKTFDSLNKPQYSGFHIPLANFEKYPFVNVEFEITPTTEIYRVAEKTSMPPQSNQRADAADETASEQEILFSAVNNSAGKKWQSRRVFLSEHVRKLYPGLRLSSKQNGIGTVASFTMDVFLHCRKCQEISRSAYEYHRGFFYKDFNYYFVCYYCHQIDKSVDAMCVKLDAASLLDYSVFENIEYFCIWNCGRTFNNAFINEHELQCSNQPLRECPMTSCDHKATLRELEHHFEESHKPRFINGKQYSSIFVSSSRFSVKQNNCSSRLRKVFFVYYLWVLTVFVRVQVSWNNDLQAEVEVNFSVCEDKRKRHQPKVSMFYNANSQIACKWISVYPDSSSEEPRPKRPRYELQN